METTNEDLVRQLADRMQLMQPGETITFGQMQDIVGAKEHLIPAAKRLTNREWGALWRPQTGIGLTLLDPNDGPRGFAQTSMKRIRRKARRDSASLVNAVTRRNDVSDDTIIQTYAAVNVLGLVEMQAQFGNVAAKVKDIIVEAGDTGAATRASLEALRALKRK